MGLSQLLAGIDLLSTPPRIVRLPQDDCCRKASHPVEIPSSEFPVQVCPHVSPASGGQNTLCLSMIVCINSIYRSKFIGGHGQAQAFPVIRVQKPPPMLDTVSISLSMLSYDILPQ